MRTQWCSSLHVQMLGPGCFRTEVLIREESSSFWQTKWCHGTTFQEECLYSNLIRYNCCVAYGTWNRAERKITSEHSVLSSFLTQYQLSVSFFWPWTLWKVTVKAAESSFSFAIHKARANLSYKGWSKVSVLFFTGCSSLLFRNRGIFLCQGNCLKKVPV